jgi:CPA2 family monovalent cation:H+ antiporter-2
MSWQAALALGGALSMSSTAIVTKLLSDRGELETEHGRNVIGVLLFQDLAVVFLLILLPALGKDPKDLFFALGIALIKISIALFLIFFVGRQIMSRWFRLVAQFRSQELFMLNLLLIYYVKITSGNGKVINGIQHVRFTRTIFPKKYIHKRAEPKACFSIIFKMGE